jgi:hypothetical protein
LKVGLVGYSGLVGSYIQNKFPDAWKFNSQNIEEIRGKSFDLLFLTTLPAEKWKANAHPNEDLENVKNLAKVCKACNFEISITIKDKKTVFCSEQKQFKKAEVKNKEIIFNSEF